MLRLTAICLVLFFVLNRAESSPWYTRPNRKVIINDVGKNLKDKLARTDSAKHSMLDKLAFKLFQLSPRFIRIFDRHEITNRQHPSFYIEYG